MSKNLHRTALRYFNFTSVLCLKFTGQTYEVCSVSSFINLLKMPFAVSVIVLMSFYEPLKDKVFQTSFLVLEGFTTFAIASIFISVLLLSVFVIFLCLLQWLQRYTIADFINYAMKQPLDEKYFLEFKRKCWKDLTVSGFAQSFYFLISFWGTFKISPFSILLMPCIMYPSLAILGFVNLVTILENFVLASLKAIRNDLKDLSRKKRKELDCDDDFSELSIKYQKIYNLVQQFQDTFGLQLTLTICVFTAVLVFNVRTCVASVCLLIKNLLF